VLIVPESVLPAAVEKRGSVTAVMHEEINVLIVDRMITQKKRECQLPNLHPSQHPKRRKALSVIDEVRNQGLGPKLVGK